MQLDKLPKNFKPLPYRNEGNCFGCGTGNSMGLKMKFFSDGNSVVSQTTLPPHLCGWHNVVHGGIVSTILDETMGWTSMYLLKRLVLTKTMTVNFIKPVFTKEQLYIEGQIVEVFDERRAAVKASVYNPAKELCAKSEAVFSLFTPETARKLDFLDPLLLDEIEDKLMR